jgi:2-phosphoglycerate kinase
MPRNGLTIIINGATGVGKTITANHLSRTLHRDYVSTDQIRQELRDTVARQLYPVLFRSSYEIDENAVAERSQKIVTNYLAQAKLILAEMGRRYLGPSDKGMIFEGVHLNAGLLPAIKNADYVIFYLRMPDVPEHRRRLRERNSLNREMSTKHSAHFDGIRTIGTFLEHQWSVEAQTNKHVFLINSWQEANALLEGRRVPNRTLVQ